MGKKRNRIAPVSGNLIAPLAEKAPKELSPLAVPADVPFIISFIYPLLKGYTFTDLQMSDIKALQGFFDKVSRMTFQQVEDAYRREDDPNDTYNDEQIIHYGVTHSFRIHGVLRGRQFVVLRLDPNHRVHGK